MTDFATFPSIWLPFILLIFFLFGVLSSFFLHLVILVLLSELLLVNFVFVFVLFLVPCLSSYPSWSFRSFYFSSWSEFCFVSFPSLDLFNFLLYLFPCYYCCYYSFSCSFIITWFVCLSFSLNQAFTFLTFLCLPQSLSFSRGLFVVVNI